MPAAKLGHPLAMYNLAMSYSRGEGIKQNYLEAYFWAGLAKRLGVKQADALLGALKNLLPAGQVKKLETKIEQWQPEAATSKTI